MLFMIIWASGSLAVIMAIMCYQRYQRQRRHHSVVVSDTSALTHLANIRQLFILRKLYGVILVPPQVAREMRRITPRNRGVWRLRWSWWWIVRVTIQKPKEVQRLLQSAPGLDMGEAQAIILAEEVRAHIVLIDEARGRAVALQRGLPVRGLLGSLLVAKQHGIIQRVKPILDALRRDGFRMSASVYDHILQLAGE